MEDPNLIVTLIPTDDCNLTDSAFCLDGNKNCYRPPTYGIEEGPTISSREATSAKEILDDEKQMEQMEQMEQMKQMKQADEADEADETNGADEVDEADGPCKRKRFFKTIYLYI